MSAVIAPVLEAYAAIDGGLDDVAAVSQFTASTAMRGAFGAIFPQLQSLPLLGGPGATADPELVLWRRPDLLIIGSGMRTCYVRSAIRICSSSASAPQLTH